MYPSEADYDLPREVAEQRVRSLAQGLPDEVVCFTQVHLIDQYGRNREIDLLVAWPGRGLAVVEVKGGQVSVTDGQWFSRNSRGVKNSIKDPVQQAEKAMWALKHYVTTRPEWTDTWPPAVVPVAVLPWSRIDPGFRTPGALAEQFLDKDACAGSATFGDALRAALEAARPDVYAETTQLQVDLLVSMLEVSLPAQTDLTGLLAEHEAVVTLLTDRQYGTLQKIRTNDRIVVNGGPGTGKTFLALEHARQEAERGARVGLVCYSRGLAEFLRKVTSAWDVDQQPAYAGTFHYLAEQWSDATPGYDTAYYDSLPGRLADAASQRQPDERFDLLVVDEAQDFSDDWWSPLLATLGDPDDGPVVVFQDDLQRIFAGRGHIPFSGVEVELDENLRNTQEIAAAFDPLYGRSVRARGPEGPPARLVRSTDQAAVDDADRAVAQLLGEGYPPSSIAVLTTYKRHPQHDRLVRAMGAAAYWDSFDADEVFYTTVQSFKGLERPVVVLAVNGFNFDAVEREILHVGMSRARSLLVVVADPRTMEAVEGGAAALDRLDSEGRGSF